MIDDERRVLAGSTGFHGPPEPDGTVEIGFGIAASERRRGLRDRVGARRSPPGRSPGRR